MIADGSPDRAAKLMGIRRRPGFLEEEGEKCLLAGVESTGYCLKHAAPENPVGCIGQSGGTVIGLVVGRALLVMVVD